jgi:flagellar biosynthesis GTPase FlhF
MVFGRIARNAVCPVSVLILTWGFRLRCKCLPPGKVLMEKERKQRTAVVTPRGAETQRYASLLRTVRELLQSPRRARAGDIQDCGRSASRFPFPLGLSVWRQRRNAPRLEAFRPVELHSEKKKRRKEEKKKRRKEEKKKRRKEEKKKRRKEEKKKIRKEEKNKRRKEEKKKRRKEEKKKRRKEEKKKRRKEEKKKKKKIRRRRK